MRKVNYIIAGLIISAISTNAFAVCEGEQKAYEEAAKRCKDWETGATATGIVGFAATLPWAGVGSFACVPPALIAKNQCRIRDERQRAVQRCHAYHAQQAQLKAEAQVKAEQHRLNMVEAATKYRAEIKRLMTIKIDNECDAHIESFNAKHLQKLNDIVKEYVDEGYDICNPEIRVEIDSKIIAAEDELTSILNRLEEERIKHKASL